MSLLDSVLEQMTENLDQRREELTKLRRVVLRYAGQTLESTVARMAIPIVYANWEGYVKEVCQLYLEHIEAIGLAHHHLQPAILGYLWTPLLRRLTGGLNFERKTAVAESALRSLGDPVSFANTEKAIDTRSKLNYENLESIGQSLCLDIAALAPRKRHLNLLVHLRNNIAHGSPPRSLSYADFDE